MLYHKVTDSSAPQLVLFFADKVKVLPSKVTPCYEHGGVSEDNQQVVQFPATFSTLLATSQPFAEV